MKKLIGLILVITLLSGASCTDVHINPTTTIFLADTVRIDPDIEKFANFLSTTWKCTKTSFTSAYDWVETESIDCASEKQFAFLKEMKITRINNSSDLKVENTYACSSQQTTYFQLAKMACCGFTIIEKDRIGQVIRIFDFVAPNGQSIWNDVLLGEKGHLATTMYVRTYDPTTFDLDSPGSLTVLPSIYMLFIEKNFE